MTQVLGDRLINDDANYYWNILGTLIYLADFVSSTSHVDIVLSQFMQEPHMVLWKDELGVLTYIMCGNCKGLIYQCYDHLHIEAYCDIGYVGRKGN